MRQNAHHNNDRATRFEDSRSTPSASTVINQDIEVAGNVSQGPEQKRDLPPMMNAVDGCVVK